MRKRTTPQEKKRKSLAKDRRNTYGESPHGARKSIPKNKRFRARVERRAGRVTAEGGSEQAFEVRTDLFEVTTPGPHFINERCFGEDFAAWLAARLAARNIESDEPGQEDWGWALLVRYGGRTFTIAIGVMDESIGETPADWRVGVSYEKMMNGVRAWFRSPPHELLAELAVVIEAVLRAEPRMKVAPAE